MVLIPVFYYAVSNPTFSRQDSFDTTYDPSLMEQIFKRSSGIKNVAEVVQSLGLVRVKLS